MARRTFCRALEASLAAVLLELFDALAEAIELEEGSERDDDDGESEEVEVEVVASSAGADSAGDNDGAGAASDAGASAVEGRTPSCTAAGETLSSGFRTWAALSSASSAVDSPSTGGLSDGGCSSADGNDAAVVLPSSPSPVACPSLAAPLGPAAWFSQSRFAEGALGELANGRLPTATPVEGPAAGDEAAADGASRRTRRVALAAEEASRKAAGGGGVERARRRAERGSILNRRGATR